MGEGAEYLSEQDDAYYAEHDIRNEEINGTKHRLSEMSDTELLDFICSKGKSLNTLETFKTYTVAKRIKDNGWKPTRKQRESLINTAAIALNS